MQHLLLATSRPTSRAHPRMASSSETAIFGMGCFWAPQEAFQDMPGVESVLTGYASVEPRLNLEPPSYFSVCSGDGYTEAVKVTYDPSEVSYEALLRVFWANHDASLTTPGKEDQYRSALWPTDEAQRLLAAADVERAAAAYVAAGKDPPCTVVAQAPPAFTPAEPYHQHFWAKGRLKLGLLVALLLLRGAGSSQLSLAADVGTQLVLLWWFVECFGLLAAASPFAELF